MALAKINGIQIYYETHGRGDPLVLVLGFTMNPTPSQQWPKTPLACYTI
jgi:hypothetical protein